MRSRTPEQRHQDLIRSGILNPDGTLADHYKPRPKRRRKKGEPPEPETPWG